MVATFKIIILFFVPRITILRFITFNFPLVAILGPFHFIIVNCPLFFFSKNFNKFMLKHRAIQEFGRKLGSLHEGGVVIGILPWTGCATNQLSVVNLDTCNTNNLISNSVRVYCRYSIFAACPLVPCVRRFVSDRPSSVRPAGCGSLSHPH